MIELMLVVTVIGILATLSIVVYTSFLRQARTVEAKSFLSALNKEQTAYFIENKEYTADVNSLGLSTLDTLKYYTDISVVLTGDLQGYTATAKGNIDNDPLLDEWTIDEEKVLLNTVSDIDN